jgi:outer membrane biosynthesis protein TonB
MICTTLLGGWAGVAAVALAGAGLFSSFALATITDNGAKPERIPMALILGVVCGLGLSVPALLELSSVDSVPQSASVSPTEVSAPAVDEAVGPAVSEVPTEEPGGDAVADGARSGADGLSEAELREARRFESAQESTPTEESAARDASTPSKGSKADVDPAAEAEKAAAAARAEDKRRQDAERRQERRREEAARREQADQRAAERRAEEKRSTGLGGPTRASLKKPDSGRPSSTKSTGPKPFVIDTIIRNNGNIKRCLEAEQARGQDLSGKIFLQFTIAADGGVSRAKLTTSRWAGTSLDTCISKHVNRLDFPPFEGKAKKISYALVIQ